MTPANDNGTPEKTPSILKGIHEAWLQKGGKNPDKKTIESIKKTLREAEVAYRNAEHALEMAREAKSKAALQAMQLLGAKTRINLEGDIGVVSPSARGDRVFYKRASDSDTV